MQGGDSGDTLGLQGKKLQLSGSTVIYNNVAVGTIDSVYNGLAGNSLQIHFNSNITLPAISALMLDVTYSHQNTILTNNHIAVFALQDNSNVYSNNAEVIINTLGTDNSLIDDD